MTKCYEVSVALGNMGTQKHYFFTSAAHAHAFYDFCCLAYVSSSDDYICLSIHDNHGNEQIINEKSSNWFKE